MSDEGERTCPLCAEEMDLTDQQLKPCKCGYEICVWCWHHIMDMAEKDDTEGRCPACRTPYDKEKIVGMAASCERLVAEINTEKKKSQKAKTKPSEGRKQLTSVRVIQRNLVYIVGLPLNLADEELLQSREYFGQYGKVLKVSMSRTAAGVIQQFPNSTCSVYITYSKEEEAVRCIQSVHGFVLDGRSLKACFGTTKYCHAWLRSVPCTNPDCLYLHEIGSQEDSFTKDEIISAYTRSRVQQITGPTNNMLRRSGSMLPPPADDYCSNAPVSAANPIVKNVSNNTTSMGKGSPPNGSSGRSIALPAAASWGMRTSNQPQPAASTCSNGPIKAKHDTVGGSLAFSSAVAGASQASIVPGDVGKKTTSNEDGQATNAKSKLDILKPVKQQSGTDCRSVMPEKPAPSDATNSVLRDQSSLSPKNSDWSTSPVSNVASPLVHDVRPCGSEKDGSAVTDLKIQGSPSDILSTKVDSSVRSEHSSIVKTGSSLTDQSVVRSPQSQGSQQSYGELCREHVTSSVPEKGAASANGVHVSQEPFDWPTDHQTQTVTNTASDGDDDIISFNNQRLKDPEVVSRPNLQNSSNSLHVSNHYSPHSFQHIEAFSAANFNAEFLDNRVGDTSLQNASSNSVISNGYPEKLIGNHLGLDRNMDHSFLLPNDGERQHIGRLQGDAEGNVALDGGESSIISNILSLGLDPSDDPFTASHNFTKLLGETDKQPSYLKTSASWRVQNNSQSRFSFARQEESRNQVYGVDPSFSVYGQLLKNRSFGQDFSDNRNSFMDKHGIGNGCLPGGFEDSEPFCGSNSVFSSNKPSVSRAQMSAPPGFSVPNRAPPPGFSSHERMDHAFDALSGNHILDPSSLLGNSYQTPPAGNISSAADIEFMDPAILAVGKGRLQGSLSNPGLDMRTNFPHQLNAFDNDARLQLLMQNSMLPHQNLRYADTGNSYSSLGNSYGISSRLVDQSQVSNLSPFAQLPLPQSRNGLMSNSHWDSSWNEVRGGNSLGMADLLGNERLGFNKFYSRDYDDSKFRMPSSGDLYNRTFDM